ncbi:MAG TPA: OmpW family outer membrane protein [Solimonas sp.]|nr:OmpW family outer membrane protein [Solimonas sp.]
MRASPFILCSTLALAGACTAASAYEKGDLLVRGGIHYVDPKSDSLGNLEVQPAAALTGSAEYFLNPQLAVDLLVAFPFEHDVELAGTGNVAEVQHLPPTLSLVWYPAIGQQWHPYVGAGLNYTIFFREKTRGPIAGQDLELDPSFGAAAMVGIDWDLGDRWGLALDARYIDIDTDGELDGAPMGNFESDPFIVGLSVSYRFRSTVR